MTEAKIINNSHSILFMKIANPNLIHRWTKKKGLSVMIGRCSHDSQHSGPGWSPANVNCSNFRYTNNYQSKYSTLRHQQKKWTREDNKKLINLF